MYEAKQLLSFEYVNGTNVIKLRDIKQALDCLEYGSQYRIYLLLLFLSLRPREPLELTWHNFVDRRLIFKPKKQIKRNVTRFIKIPTKLWDELIFYRDNNHFYKDKLFPWKDHGLIRRQLNKKLRRMFGGLWMERSGNLRMGRVPQYYRYTLRCFRTTAATLVYHYYSLVYGNGDLALSMTCNYMKHSSRKTTAEYYIKRITDLGLENYPDVPLLELYDLIIYEDVQLRVSDFIPSGQKLMIEY